MGTWDTDLWSDDTAADVRSAYRAGLVDGLGDGAAAAKVLDDFAGALDDEDDHGVVWIALAMAQSDLGRLATDVKTKAIDLIDSDVDLRRWVTSDPSTIAERRDVLDRVRAQLLGPQPKRKVLRKSSMRLRYQPGDWFAVPLRDREHCGVGLVARTSPGGVLFGYFFGPKRNEVPSLGDLRGLRPEHAILLERFSHLGLKSGDWPIVGRDDDWSPSEWPMPSFQHVQALTGNHILVTYADDDPSRCLSRRIVSAQQTRGLPSAGMGGAGAVEIRLTKVLAAAQPPQ